MKINEIIINEGVWDSVKNAASGVKGIAGNAINSKSLNMASNAVKATGNELKNFANYTTNAAKRIGNGKLFKSVTGQKTQANVRKNTYQQQQIKNQFIKNFNQMLQKQIIANKVANVPFDLNTFVNQLAKKDGLDLTHSAYGSKFAPAIKAAQDSKYSPASINVLGSLMYSAAVAAQSGITTATVTQPATNTQSAPVAQPATNTQPTKPRQPVKPGGNVYRIK